MLVHLFIYNGTIDKDHEQRRGSLKILGYTYYENYYIEYYSIAPGKIVYEVFDQNTNKPFPVPSERAEKIRQTNRRKGNQYLSSSVPAFSFGETAKFIGTCAFAVIVLFITGDPYSAGLVLDY